jgi:hypothetical protein
MANGIQCSPSLSSNIGGMPTKPVLSKLSISTLHTLQTTHYKLVFCIAGSLEEKMVYDWESILQSGWTSRRNLKRNPSYDYKYA